MGDFWNVKLKHAVVSYTYTFEAMEKIYFPTGFEQVMHKIPHEFYSSEEKK